MCITSMLKSTGINWDECIDISSPTLTNYYVVNNLLSFGGSGDKLLAVATNEDLTNAHYIYLFFLKGAGGSS